jgi:hypothetical protein
MNTSPGDADNPAGVFVAPHGGRVCAAAQWPQRLAGSRNIWTPACGCVACGCVRLRLCLVAAVPAGWLCLVAAVPAGGRARLGVPALGCLPVRCLRGRRPYLAGTVPSRACARLSACRVHPPDRPGESPHPQSAGTERRSGGKTRKSCWRRAGRGLLTVPARIWAGSRRGSGMDSVTRGSGIALSVLIAMTASILLLLPGKPAGSWPGPGTSGQVVMASAVATSSSRTLGSGSQPSASSRAGGQPAAGARPWCRAVGARSGRARAGLVRPGVARPGSCRPPRAHRDQHTSRRLPRYRGIRPDLP